MRNVCSRLFMSLFGLNVFIALTLICINKTWAAPGGHIPSGEIMITVAKSDLTLVQFFEVTEKQTPLSFGYDENLVNIHQRLQLPVGQHLLISLLNSISKQTGLSFNLQKNLVLVSNSKNT